MWHSDKEVVPITTLHTFGLPAQANNILSISRADQLCHPLPRPFVILGQGSNSIFVDDFDGTIIKVDLKGIEHHQTDHEHKLIVASGENWHELVCWTVERGIVGLENLALIPGTVGAAPIQNIGAYGREVGDFIVQVDYVDLTDLQPKSLTNAQCQFGYRDSIFKHQLLNNAFITHVHLRFSKSAPIVSHYGELAQLISPDARQVFDKVIAIRKAKLPDPAKLGNAGSFFKNPVIRQSQYKTLQRHYPDIPGYPVMPDSIKLPAAWLIDQLGFKGKQLGKIACHQQQPLVLVNLGGGRGTDLVELARQIKQQVKQVFDVELEHEVRLYGRRGAIQL